MDTKKFAYDVCRGYLQDLQRQDPWISEILTLVRNRNLSALCDVRNSFSMHCHDAESYRILLQVEAFFKKNEAFSDRDTCLSAAKRSFSKAEFDCYLTNKRLTHLSRYPNRFDPKVVTQIRRAKSWIMSNLGPIEDFIRDIPKLVRVTDGATSTSSRKGSRPFMKIKRTYHASGKAAPYIESLAAYFGYPGVRVEATSLNRVEFVPKNWKTYRTIACEPDGALPFQLAFDSYGKTKLRSYGVDLRDQSRNQRLSQIGSIDGSFATIDLSSASDTVALNTIHTLFPREWVEYLLCFRSAHYRCPITGQKRAYHKFSSMGNGATFVLESYVFAACCWAVGSSDFSVYGDDIVIETDKAADLIALLKLLGFSVNLDKTFLEGDYRESCGSHWFKGTLITPFFCRGNLDLDPFLCHNINGLVGISRPEGKLWSMLRTHVLLHKLLITPWSLVTTAGIHVDSVAVPEWKKLTSSKHWISWTRAYVFHKREYVVDDIRSLILWYHDSFRFTPDPKWVLSRDELLCRERVRSRYSMSTEKYRRRRVRWVRPTQEAPATLLWWSEYLARFMSRCK